MSQIGEQLEMFRQSVMKDRRIGLTALYNLVHSTAIDDEDIVRLREIHVEIDEAVQEAYALDEDREPTIREYEAKVASVLLPPWTGDRAGAWVPRDPAGSAVHD